LNEPVPIGGEVGASVQKVIACSGENLVALENRTRPLACERIAALIKAIVEDQDRGGDGTDLERGGGVLVVREGDAALIVRDKGVGKDLEAPVCVDLVIDKLYPVAAIELDHIVSDDNLKPLTLVGMQPYFDPVVAGTRNQVASYGQRNIEIQIHGIIPVPVKANVLQETTAPS
jgi:hypothetical protein